MTPDITRLVEFDTDGALQEAAGKLSRAGFFKRAGAVAGAGLAAGMIPAALASAQGVPKSDIAILNYALTLEYLEAAFYKKALADGALRGQFRNFAEITGQHEDAHVAALKKTLGSKAVKRPTSTSRARPPTRTRSPRPRSCSRTPASRPTRARPGTSRRRRC